MSARAPLTLTLLWSALPFGLLTLALFLTSGQAHAVTLDEYAATLQQSLAAAEAGADTGDPARRAAALAAVRARLGAVVSVELPDGRALAVDNPPLRSALDADDLD